MTSHTPNDKISNEASGALREDDIPSGDRTRIRTIYLIRHGQSEWNQDKRIAGQLDPPLSPLGMSQAQALAEVLGGQAISTIVTSSLQRTKATALPLSRHLGLTIQSEDGLMEMHMGVLQGQVRDRLDATTFPIWQAYKTYRTTYRIPGGESFQDLATRTTRCLQRILVSHQGDGALLIVGHRNTNRVLLGTLMEWPSSFWFKLDLRHSFLYRISLDTSPRIETTRLDGLHKGQWHEGFYPDPSVHDCITVVGHTL